MFVYGLRVVSLPLLIFVAMNGSLFWLYVFAVIFGFTFIANMAPTVGIVRNHYGLASTGVLVGWLLLSHQIGGAAGTYLGGLIYEAAGGYAPVFILMAVAALFGAVFSLGIKRPRSQLE